MIARIVIVFMLFCNVVMAQEPASKDTATVKDTTVIDSLAQPIDTIGWHVSGLFDLKFTQVSLHNWAGGGQSSLAFNTALSLTADYKGEHTTWTNTLDMDYGFFNQAKSPYWAKSDDRIELNSLFGRIAWKHWEYETFLSFRSQFAPGYTNPLAPDSAKVTISDFLAPGYFGFGFGMDYKPSEHFNILVAPFSAKVTLVNNQTLADMGSFGVTNEKDSLGAGIPGSGKKSRKEFGGTFKIMYKSQLTEKFDLHTCFDLFTNYSNNPQNIDVNCEIIANWKINRFLSVSINAVLIYDHDVQITRNTSEIDPLTGLFITKTGPITQFRELLGFGFNYSFNK
jgi:Protein of unknown function (DUF3078)